MVGDMFSFIWLDNDDLSIQENKARELARIYPRGVNEENLIKKVCRFNTPHKTIFKQGNPMQLLKQVFETKLERLFPYICIILRIFNTIPVLVARGEQSFSKSLSLTMCLDRVTDLLIILVEEGEKGELRQCHWYLGGQKSSKNSSLSILLTFLKGCCWYLKKVAVGTPDDAQRKMEECCLVVILFPYGNFSCNFYLHL